MSKVAVIYWSATGNTEAMANAVCAGLKDGGADAAAFAVSDFDKATMDQYDKFAFGCPSMGAEELEETEFEPFYTEIEPKLAGKPVALFGSYDWGDGEWMRLWQDRVAEKGGVLFQEGLIINLTPDDAGIKRCEDFGKAFAS